MSDHHSGYIVVLEQDLKDDAAQPVLNALRQIKGVLSVTPVVADVMGGVAEMRAESRIKRKLLYAVFGEGDAP